LDYIEVKILFQSLEIAIGGKFAMITPDGQQLTMDPSPDGNIMHLAPFLRILRQVCSKGIAFNEGSLLLVFADSTRIEVPVDPDFEAWNASDVRGLDGLKVVSLPGGDLAIWQGRP
jgi:hypothetical protein